MKDIGVLLALDDFGTGRSSLTSLKRFDIDALKLDQSLVSDLTKDKDGASIISAMVDVGKNLHVRVVAEGVETQEQLKMLQRCGCPQAQGFYFSQPVPAEDFGRLLKSKVSTTVFA